MKLVRATRATGGAAQCARRSLLGGLLALSVTSGFTPKALAQTDGCAQVERAGLVSSTSNVDLVVRDAGGRMCQVRIAGLQAWPFGWPQADEIPDQVAAQVRGGALRLA